MQRKLTHIVLIVLAVMLVSCRSDVVPGTTFSTITGKKITLHELRGKPVIVTFWATSCASCIKEIPHLIALYQQYHDKGLEIIAVAMAYDPPNHVLDMSKSLQLPYHVALDMQSENAHAFGDVSLTPTTFLIAPDGSIALHKTGLFDINEIKAQLLNFTQG
jgi:thiol-disulfide isomerase/thioredoxin